MAPRSTSDSGVRMCSTVRARAGGQFDVPRCLCFAIVAHVTLFECTGCVTTSGQCSGECGGCRRDVSQTNDCVSSTADVAGILNFGSSAVSVGEVCGCRGSCKQ